MRTGKRSSWIIAGDAIEEGVEDEMVRPLGSQEYMFYLFQDLEKGVCSVNETLVVETKAPLSEWTLRVAMETVGRQLPILQTRVQLVGGVHWLMTSQASVQLEELPAGEDWLQHQERIINEVHIDVKTGPMWRGHLLNRPANLPGDQQLTDKYRAVIYLTFCHAAVDGMSALVIFRQLLEVLDRLLRGLPPRRIDEPPVVPDSSDVLLERHGLNLPSLIVYRIWDVWTMIQSVIEYLLGRTLSSMFTRSYNVRREYRNRLLPAWLSAARTTKLLALCRQHGVGANSALSAALALASARLASQRRPDSFKLPFSVRCSWAVDLRRFLKSHVDASGLVLCCASRIKRLITVPALELTSFWPLARQIDLNIKGCIEVKEPIYSLITSGLCKAALTLFLRQPIIDISVNGRRDVDTAIPSFETVEVKQYHFMASISPRLNEQSFATGEFTTADGVLWYDSGFIEGQVRTQDVEKLSQLVLEVLHHVTDKIGLRMIE